MLAQNLVLEFDVKATLCEFSISNSGKQISVTMNLWYGDTLTESWVKSGGSIINLGETCTVSRRRTYTLKVYGTNVENLLALRLYLRDVPFSK